MHHCRFLFLQSSLITGTDAGQFMDSLDDAQSAVAGVFGQDSQGVVGHETFLQRDAIMLNIDVCSYSTCSWRTQLRQSPSYSTLSTPKR